MVTRALVPALLAAVFVALAPAAPALAQGTRGSSTGVMICSKCGLEYTGGGACPRCYPPSNSSSGSGGYDPNALRMQMAGQLGTALGQAFNKWLFDDSEARERAEAAEAQRAAMLEYERRLAEQRRREEEERRRIEEERRQRELMEQTRQARVRNAAQMRRDLERRDQEMTERLDGMFEVLRKKHSSSFFGIPGNADSERITDAPTDHPPAARSKTGRGSSLSELEAQLRAAASNHTWTTASPETEVAIGGPAAQNAANDPLVVDLRNQGSLVPRIPSMGSGTPPPGLDGIQVPAPGHVVRWPTNPNPLINPLREPGSWDALVQRERLQYPDIYRRVDAMSQSSLHLITDEDMLSLLFPDRSPEGAKRDADAVLRQYGRKNIQRPGDKDLDLLFPSTPLQLPQDSDLRFLFDR